MAKGDTRWAAATDSGPDELYELGLSQLRQRGANAARRTFRQLLQQYPNAKVAPDAQYYLGAADEILGDMAAADSAYQMVYQRYPSSWRASTALLKHAEFLEADGDTDAARAAYQAILYEYPQSDEAVLAKDRLRHLRYDRQPRPRTTSRTLGSFPDASQRLLRAPPASRRPASFDGRKDRRDIEADKARETAPITVVSVVALWRRDSGSRVQTATTVVLARRCRETSQQRLVASRSDTRAGGSGPGPHTGIAFQRQL